MLEYMNTIEKGFSDRLLIPGRTAGAFLPYGRMRGFRSKVAIRYETSDWIVETADSTASLDASLRLRHEVFCDELQGRILPGGIERDDLDDRCDHLLIWDKREGRLAGTYRLFSSHYFPRFYSEEEFHLDTLLAASDEPKLELGRACIRRAYRDGAVIQLLWRGIALYLTATRSRYLLGCSSVQSLDVGTAVNVSAWMRSRDLGLDSCFGVVPQAEYRTSHPSVFGPSGADSMPSALSDVPVPGLIAAYATAGARFSLEPAFDCDFNCVDFFTYLDLRNLNPLFRRRYFPREDGVASA